MDSFGPRAKRGTVSFFLAFTLLHAQPSTGDIHIEVKDPSGAVVEASGTLRNVASGGERAFQTDARGTYDFEGLPFGRYRLEIAKAGFATQSVDVDVQSATPISRTITLAIGTQSSRLDVVAATPLAGTDLSRNQIAGPVQTATAADVQSSGALDLADFMNRRLNGVYTQRNAANPFQPDVNFRGYTASPLLGTPEGISVYLDGVRQNQPFGDVVSWDLIPKNAISEITLIPGSDPLFGLNTLGGALSVQTKDGVSNPGMEGTAHLWQQRAQSGGGRATAAARRLASTGFWPGMGFMNRDGASIRHPTFARHSCGWAGAPIRPISRSPRLMPTTP